ncbi:unnamed protein product [Dracunculus medinensis]|uniref:Reverse transcriptase domain-containing protein n=1 Tax=Dracunculus medinensis TaxID=318479 RepID=A0A0N4UAD3_DRAME|nr:unnamed protein product [Dracunculus medinensis]
MTRGTVKWQDSNGVLIKNIKNRLIRWKEFFEAKLNHESIAPNVTDTFAEAYACEPPTEEKIISIIHKLKANETPGEDGLRALNSSNFIHRPAKRIFNKCTL